MRERLTTVRCACLAIILAVALVASPAAQAPPLAILLVVDVTASSWLRLLNPNNAPHLYARGVPWPTTAERLQTAIETAFIPRLPDGARARFALASRHLRTTDQFAADHFGLVRSWRSLLPVPRDEHDGPSRIWDLTAHAIELVGKEPGRRMIVLITDGEATRNQLHPDDVVRIAGERAVTIHVISLAFDIELPQADRSVSAFIRPNDALRRIAERTGGVFLFQGEPRPYNSDSTLPSRSSAESRARMDRARWIDLREPLGELMKLIAARQ